MESRWSDAEAARFVERLRRRVGRGPRAARLLQPSPRSRALAGPPRRRQHLGQGHRGRPLRRRAPGALRQGLGPRPRPRRAGGPRGGRPRARAPARRPRTPWTTSPCCARCAPPCSTRTRRIRRSRRRSMPCSPGASSITPTPTPCSRSATGPTARRWCARPRGRRDRAAVPLPGPPPGAGRGRGGRRPAGRPRDGLDAPRPGHLGGDGAGVVRADDRAGHAGGGVPRQRSWSGGGRRTGTPTRGARSGGRGAERRGAAGPTRPGAPRRLAAPSAATRTAPGGRVVLRRRSRSLDSRSCWRGGRPRGARRRGR